MEEGSGQLSVCGHHNRERKLILNLSQPLCKVAGNSAHKPHLSGSESPI